MKQYPCLAPIEKDVAVTIMKNKTMLPVPNKPLIQASG